MSKYDNKKKDYVKEETSFESEKVVDDKPISAGKRPIVKQDGQINIGSVDGGKDRVLILKKGNDLPAEIEDKFLSSLKGLGLI